MDLRCKQRGARVTRDWRHTRLHESGWGGESWVSKRQEVERHEADGMGRRAASLAAEAIDRWGHLALPLWGGQLIEPIFRLSFICLEMATQAQAARLPCAGSYMYMIKPPDCRLT